GRNSNPQLAQILPQSAELGRVTKNKEVKELYEERNNRTRMEISPENQGKLADPSSNRDELISNFKNQGASSGLQLSNDPKGDVISPDFRRESSLQLCEGIGPPFLEILREPKARITGNIMVNLQRNSSGRRKDVVPSFSGGDVPKSAENPPLPFTQSGD
ncbi:hypothetical protein U1Q18_035614, partial [Sarracenia purpurea var. burkii]